MKCYLTYLQVTHPLRTLGLLVRTRLPVVQRVSDLALGLGVEEDMLKSSLQAKQSKALENQNEK